MIVDVKVIKAFQGLQEGQFTQLRESEFLNAEKAGFVEKVETTKHVKKETIIESKKGTKK